MSLTKNASLPGSQLAAKLKEALVEYKKVLEPGSRDLPILRGLTPFDYDEPQENVQNKALQILIDSTRVFVYDNNVVMEIADQQTGAKKLIPLCTGMEVKKAARFLLANIFICECKGKQIPIPEWFIQQLFMSERVLKSLPLIKIYATKPVFDENYQIWSPGWHPESGVLVHGPEVELFMEECNLKADEPVNRLPPRLRQLLQGFCFKSPADLANTVGMLLTGLLFNLFIGVQKALWLVDGNQPGLGKTLLVQVAGALMDGRQPRRIPYLSNDRELENKLCADLRGNCRQSIILFDNAKTKKGSVLSSPVIESNCTSPRISIRILCTSDLFETDNVFLWFITMNDTRACQDLINRSSVIQLSFVGKPEKRHFTLPDPFSFALQHRLEILGELAGLVKKWDQRDRPPGQQHHRQHQWAGVIGGILDIAGLPGFLGNADEAASSFSPELDQLGALAEQAILSATSYNPQVQVTNLTATPEKTATECISWFETLGILFDEQSMSKGSLSKAIKVGQYLSRLVEREVPFVAYGRTGRATLRCKFKGSNEKVYFFELYWDNEINIVEINIVASDTPVLPTDIPPMHVQSSIPDTPTAPDPIASLNAPNSNGGGNTETW